ncbi:similar to Saccharomyces cerevisiae YGR016W Putative protein of unknown function [Maudiozyma saulgeensis]|uniref:Uncharacterized protein n=1 Tax=Maudiozyma saulgeensis TaxID=1789683 RepID=A0A1X7RA40_9SACH|nr:similar to Saccharomyces cerevisiae YGR016W Putative protein of unknown function [Kazachstania saulgeensis]
MVRFRKLNGGLWGSEEKLNETVEDEDFGFPMDEDDQDNLIKKLERRNYKERETSIQILSMLLLVCAGIFLAMATRVKSRDIASMLLAGVPSIVCSWMTLRYNLVNDYCLFKSFRLYVNERYIDILNYTILILISWVSWNEYENDWQLQLLFQIPLLLKITAIIMKSWSLELDKEFDSLRALKYKYKSA